MKSFAFAIALLITPTMCLGQQLDSKEVGVFDFSKGQRDLDILGIRVGDTVAEAKASGEKEGFAFVETTITRGLSNPQGIKSSISYVFLLSGSKSAVSTNEGLVIFVSSPLSGSKVLGVSRGVNYTQDYPGIDTISAALESRYPSLNFEKDEDGYIIGDRSILNGAESTGLLCAEVLNFFSMSGSTLARESDSNIQFNLPDASDLIMKGSCTRMAEDQSGFLNSPAGQYSFFALASPLYGDKNAVSTVSQDFFDEGGYIFDEKILHEALTADIEAQMNAKPEAEAPKL